LIFFTLTIVTLIFFTLTIATLIFFKLTIVTLIRLDQLKGTSLTLVPQFLPLGKVK
jgi:hypothetical protein